MKRPLILLLAIALLVAMAPAAFAEHCLRCRYFPSSGTVGCAPALTLIGGWTECTEISDTQCELSGMQCEPHGSALMPLETEFTVASVERLDEPRSTTTTEILVAANVSPAAR